ncbi:Tn3 family transposase [Nonomuraea sp. NPDC047897]|uniref:Tn3 family transposase n=1 Tax=Nonomuraea sp. NPDC047897 TaxID=3364346 RepID=UPI0037169E87
MLSFDECQPLLAAFCEQAGLPASATKLAAEIEARMPERTLIEIVSRTAYWLGWHRRFGPVSGHDSKLTKPQERHVLTTFACGSNMCGSNMGPDEAARHIEGITAHEISLAEEPAPARSIQATPEKPVSSAILSISPCKMGAD